MPSATETITMPPRNSNGPAASSSESFQGLGRIDCGMTRAFERASDDGGFDDVEGAGRRVDTGADAVWQHKHGIGVAEVHACHDRGDASIGMCGKPLGIAERMFARHELHAEDVFKLSTSCFEAMREQTWSTPGHRYRRDPIAGAKTWWTLHRHG